jgi:general secretion pathway protein G
VAAAGAIPAGCVRLGGGTVVARATRMQNRTKRHPPRLLRGDRGMTLIEILVVLAIIALISGVVAVAVIRHLEAARIVTTRESARVLRNAVTTHRMTHAADDCPSVATLLAAQEIDSASKTLDAWDRPFTIACDEHGLITVVSGGPDKTIGTNDDVRVPEPPPSVASVGE